MAKCQSDLLLSVAVLDRYFATGLVANKCSLLTLPLLLYKAASQDDVCMVTEVNTWKFVLVCLLNGLLWAGQNKLSTWIQLCALEMCGYHPHSSHYFLSTYNVQQNESHPKWKI